MPVSFVNKIQSVGERQLFLMTKFRQQRKGFVQALSSLAIGFNADRTARYKGQHLRHSDCQI
jgi:hypothetical protein